MELTNENELKKVCKLCSINLPVSLFRPKRNMCKCCVKQREDKAQKELMRNYYYKNRERLLEYKREYFNNKFIGIERQKRGPKGPRKPKQNEIENALVSV
jgi:hypothetical protein